MRRIRRNNNILLAALAIFVLAVFVYGIWHIDREATPRPASVAAPSQP